MFVEIGRQLVTGSSALNASSLDRLKYGWQVKVQSGHLHRYIFDGVLIHRRTRLIRAKKYNKAIICNPRTVTHMIIATLVTFYQQNRKKIANLNRQQRTHVSCTKHTHMFVMDQVSYYVFLPIVFAV